MKQKNRQNSSQLRRAEGFAADLRAPFIFCVLEAIILFLLCLWMTSALKENIDDSSFKIILIYVSVFYAISAGIITIVFSVKYSGIKRAKAREALLNTEINDVFGNVIDYPFTLVDVNGHIISMNRALQDILGYKGSVYGMKFSDFCPISIKSIIPRAKNREFFTEGNLDIHEGDPMPEVPVVRLANGRRYEITCYIIMYKGEDLYFTVFTDVNDHLELIEKTERESPVIAFITLDNLQELTQFVRADYRTAAAEIEKILSNWVYDMHGLLREYDRDKYLAIFSKEELDRQIEQDFDIQHRIMSLQIGDNSFPVTVSMGIASINGTIEEKEKAARDAMNIAIQRGGNQVAIKREGASGYIFIGGTHKTIENNTSIVSRVTGEILEENIRTASNIIIMGHSSPDFDSVGSCVGLARFSMSVLKECGRGDTGVNIVIDKNCDTFRICYRHLEPLGIYDKIFITRDAVNSLVTPETVLIISDVNNIFIYEAPDLAKTVNKIAVIDHHRLVSALSFNPFLQYVETTKSSASEIVAEIMEQSNYASCLHKEEAAVMLAGIMLDTHNYTRNAGSQTFAITHYLYTRGAHTNVTSEFFNEDIDEVLITSDFESRAKMYRNEIVITQMEGNRSPSEDRILASKVADRLLSVNGIEASFALIRIGNDVVISGRSKGRINVQLILERLKGGGHFDMAGAQIRESGLEASVELLKSAIDDYYEYDIKS